MSAPTGFLLLLWCSIAGSLPLAPAPPDFNADFSKQNARQELMPIVGEEELQNLRLNGFQDQLHHLRQKTIGRNSTTVTEEMARLSDSIEVISDLSVDSNEIHNDISVPASDYFKKSSKFAELSQIHNTDASNKALPPYAFSEDHEDYETDSEDISVLPPISAAPLKTRPSSTPVNATTVSTQLPRAEAATQSYLNVDSDSKVQKNSTTTTADRTIRTSQVSTQMYISTTLPTILPSTVTIAAPATKSSPHPVTRTPNTVPPHIFSSTTKQLRSAIPLTTSTTTVSHAPENTMTTTRAYRVLPVTSEFRVEPVQKRNEGQTSLRERIRSTSQLLNLLGDKIEGIDQRAVSDGVEPKTGILRNVYNRGGIKRRNYQTKQWGVSGERRLGLQTYDGEFSGLAHGNTKQRGGGYIMRKKMIKSPWLDRRYKTRRLGERRPAYMRPTAFLERRTTYVAVDPYGSERRGVNMPQRSHDVRNVSERQKSFAQSLFESEEASIKQLKKTLRKIRDVMNRKTAFNKPSLDASAPTFPTHPITGKINRVDSEFFNGAYNLRRVK